MVNFTVNQILGIADRPVLRRQERYKAKKFSKSQKAAQNALSRLPLEPKGWSPVQIIGFHKFLLSKKECYKQSFEEVQRCVNENQFMSLGKPSLYLYALCSNPARLEEIFSGESRKWGTWEIVRGVQAGYYKLTLSEILDALVDNNFSNLQIFYACQNVIENLEQCVSVENARGSHVDLVKKVMLLLQDHQLSDKEMEDVEFGKPSDQRFSNRYLFLKKLCRKIKFEDAPLALLGLHRFSSNYYDRSILLDCLQKLPLKESQDLKDVKPLIEPTLVKMDISIDWLFNL